MPARCNASKLLPKIFGGWLVCSGLMPAPSVAMMRGPDFDFSTPPPWSDANPDPIIVAPPGTTPSNPFLPPQPTAPRQPWIFAPVVVTNPSSVLWFDPEVAIGYIYNVQPAVDTPLFDQFTAPALPFNIDYQLFSTGGSTCSSNPDDYSSLIATITPNTVQDFSPLACFAIKGIDERNALDPLNTLAFNAGISFDKTGTVTVTQTPIPSPGPLPALGVGAALAWSRGLRRRVGKARSGHGARTTI